MSTDYRYILIIAKFGPGTTCHLLLVVWALRNLLLPAPVHDMYLPFIYSLPVTAISGIKSVQSLHYSDCSKVANTVLYM